MDESEVSSGGRPPQGAVLAVPWRGLLIAFAAIATAALGALAVVASVKDADTLSTIALALAILAFAATLIVTLAQAMAGAQQTAQVERINAEAKSGLAALHATSNALLSNQKETFAMLLRAALGSSAAEVADDNGTEDETPRGEVVSFSEPVNVRALLSTLGSSSSRLSPEPDSQATPQFHALDHYPEEGRGRSLATEFGQLSPWEAISLRRIAGASRDRARRGLPTGRWIRRSSAGMLPAARSLLDRGLITIDEEGDGRHPSEEFYWRDLTDAGIALASLVTASGKTPDWLREEIDASLHE